MTTIEIITLKLKWSLYLSDETLETVGNHIGKKKWAISKYLSGKHKMPCDVFCEFCKALGVGTDWVADLIKPTNELDKLAQEQIDEGKEITRYMQQSKRLGSERNLSDPEPEPEVVISQPEPEPAPDFIRRDWQKDKMRLKRENVDLSLIENPNKSDEWHAERCGVLVRFVIMRKQARRLAI